VLVSILLIVKYAKGFVANISVLLGIVFGVGVSLALGRMTLREGGKASGWTWCCPSTSACRVRVPALPRCARDDRHVMIESTGMFLALGEMTDRKISQQDLTRGLRTDGLGTVIGGMFNTFPYTSFSQNVGLVAVTGVKSRYVCVAGGVLLIVLGLLPEDGGAGRIAAAARSTHWSPVRPCGARKAGTSSTASRCAPGCTWPPCAPTAGSSRTRPSWRSSMNCWPTMGFRSTSGCSRRTRCATTRRSSTKATSTSSAGCARNGASATTSRIREGKHRLVSVGRDGRIPAGRGRRVPRGRIPPARLEARCRVHHSFVPSSRLTSGRYTTSDHDYTRPRADLRASSKDPRPTGQADGEVYQWHAQTGGRTSRSPAPAGPPPTIPRQKAATWHAAHAGAAHRRRARPGQRQPARHGAGHTFRLAPHPHTQANAEYLVLDTRLLIEDIGENSQPKEATDRKQQWKVEVDLTAHPVAEALRPALTQPKPLCEGPQTALVVGPEGQNMWTDAYGRIKVQFPWDRVGRKNQHSSCWLRVGSPWAGNQLGGTYLPRIGQEVIVDFIGGDPDLPLCTGRVHNQNNKPPGRCRVSRRFRASAPGSSRPKAATAPWAAATTWCWTTREDHIQVQLKSDHQREPLGLGAITRIEGHEGRKDPRGEGFELRTDGHGVLRAKDGLLLSAEARGNAANLQPQKNLPLPEIKFPTTLCEDCVLKALKSGSPVAAVGG
jgi:uncharacterized protein involved in type VI secretion and phage assembly